MEMPTIPLVVEDFLAVILSGLGIFLIARLIARLDRTCGHLASLGFLLIVLGGFFSAVGKLTLATTELYIPVFNHTRLILLAPGFVLLAWATWKTFNSGPSGTPVWVVPVIVIIVGCGAAAVSALSKGGRRWFFILLGLTILAQAAVITLLIWQAQRRKLATVVAFFVCALMMILLQAGLAIPSEKSSTWQWMEQINHTLLWMVVGYAVWQLEQNIIKKTIPS